MDGRNGRVETETTLEHVRGGFCVPEVLRRVLEFKQYDVCFQLLCLAVLTASSCDLGRMDRADLTLL